MLHTWYLTFSLQIPSTGLLFLGRANKPGYQATRQSSIAHLSIVSQTATNYCKMLEKKTYFFHYCHSSSSTAIQISYFSKSNGDRGMIIGSMMEKTRTSTDVTHLSYPMSVSQASRICLSVFTEVSRSTETQIYKPEEPSNELEPWPLQLWESYKQLEPQSTKVIYHQETKHYQYPSNMKWFGALMYKNSTWILNSS